MKIGLVTPQYPPTIEGGGEISAKLLADQLVARGETVEVFSFDGGERTSVDGVTVHRFERIPTGLTEVANPYAVATLYRLRERLENFDVLHAYNIALNPAVGTVSNALDVPSVATLNSYDPLPKASFGVQAGTLRRAYELLAMPTTGKVLRHQARKIDRFVALSEASRSVYRRSGFDDVPIDVVPNMIDPGFTVPDASSDGDDFDLLYVGSLIREKGVEYLVRAVAELPEDVRLRVVGDGNRARALRSLAIEMGLSDRVVFEGWAPYEDLREYYALADLFVHPGVWPEPFGRTILEAMQAGLPVVTTDVGGPAEVVPQADFRCDPREPTDLADAIEMARSRPEEGARNRSYVHERYDPDVVLGELFDVYETAIDGG